MKTAQVDESRAQLFIAEGKFDQAEAAARKRQRRLRKVDINVSSQKL